MFEIGRCRSTCARWFALYVAAYAHIGSIGTVEAQQPPSAPPSLRPIPHLSRELRPDVILPVSGGDETEIRQLLRVDVTHAGTSSKDELARATQRLPFAQLPGDDQRLVSGIVRNPSLYRRLPTITCRADPRVYSYFVEHPDVAVSIWRVMGISDMQMRQVAANEYETDLKDGTVGAVRVLHRSPGCQVILCTGDFKSPVLVKPVRATGLMCLQSQRWVGTDGVDYVTHSADVFVVLHSEAVEAVAKLISPMGFKMADKNFEEVTLFIRMMDQAMSTQPGWVEQTASQLEGIVAGRDKELLEIAAKVYVDARRRELQQAGGPVSLEAIRPPVRAAGR